MQEFFRNKKNIVIIGAVCLVCILFVFIAVKSDRQQAADVPETSAFATMSDYREETATPTDFEEEHRVFARPASSLKEISGDDGEEYVPAPFKLNLAYFYPEGADTSDAIHSYAGEIFQTLNTLNADYLANYYDMSDMTPLSFANRQGQGVGRIMGKYNPNDSRHDPKDPSTWKINSFRNVTVNFYDGDGNRINGYYAVQEIMSMASVYAYYHDMNDAEAMEEYCRELFKNAMSSRVSMGSVYYDSGCLNRSKQDEAAEAIALEAQQLATEHQLAGATAFSSGLTEGSNTGSDPTGTAGTVSGTNVIISGGSQVPSAESNVVSSAAGESETAGGTVIIGGSQTTSSGNRVPYSEDQVVVSHASGSTSGSQSVVSSGSADGETSSYAVYGGNNSTAAGSQDAVASESSGEAASNGSGDADAAGDQIVSSGQNEPVAGGGTEASESYAVISSDISASGTSEPQDITSEGTVTSGGSSGDDAGIYAAPQDEPYTEEGLVVSPATNLRKLFKFIHRPLLWKASAGLAMPVARLADEDMVVSPASNTLPETASENTGSGAGGEAYVVSDPAVVQEEPAAAPETAVQETEPAAAENAPSEEASASENTQETAVETTNHEGAASDTSVVSSAATGAGTVIASGIGTENYGYAVAGANGTVYSPAAETAVSDGTAGTETMILEQRTSEELSEEEAAIAAQINDLLAQANVLSGADQYCPGHIDLYITITIKGIDDRNGLFKADKIGNDEANFNDRWQGWTTDKIAQAKALNHQDWFEKYGLSISSINLTSQLTEEEIQNYLNTLPSDVSELRKAVVDFALHSVGKVPYYWGGKPSGPGYEPNSFYTLVSADYHGRILRGLDCSGWVNWVYWSATGTRLAGESTGTLIGCGRRISRSALRPGDIIIRTGADAHVVMFLGWVGNGNFIGIHETGGVRNNVVVGEMTASWPYYRSLID